MRAWAHVAELIKPKTLQGGLVVRSTSGLPFTGRVKGVNPSTRFSISSPSAIAASPQYADTQIPSSPRFLLQVGMEVFFVPPQIDAPRQGKVESIQQINNDSYLVHFDTITDIDTAEALVGCFCLVRRSDLPDDSDVPPSRSWVGFAVNDAYFDFLGTVSEIRENPAQSLLVVRGAKGEILIPLVDEFVKVVDEEQGIILTKIPAGLLELAVGGRSSVDED